MLSSKCDSERSVADMDFNDRRAEQEQVQVDTPNTSRLTGWREVADAALNFQAVYMTRLSSAWDLDLPGAKERAGAVVPMDA